MEIERGEDGSFNRNDVAKAFRMAMVWDLRANARDVAAVFGDRKLHQEHYIGGLVKFVSS